VGPVPKIPKGRCRVCGQTCGLCFSGPVPVANYHWPPGKDSGPQCSGFNKPCDYDAFELTRWREYLSICQRGRKSPRRPGQQEKPPKFIQIIDTDVGLMALDEAGVVWKFSQENLSDRNSEWSWERWDMRRR
jgi:hypothetical protein